MKKTFAFLAALAVSLLSFSAYAQEDKQVFNHVALGVSAGIDGLGVEAILPATPFLQIRGGYSFFPYTYKNTLNLGQYEMNGKTIELNNIPLTASIWKGGLGKVLLDIYPGKTLPFHFVAGAFIGSGKLVGGCLDGSKAIPQEDYKTGIGMNGITISSDEKGMVYADAAVLKVLPYLGLGFGRGLNPNKRVTFSFELGVVYTGGIKATVYDYSNPSGVQSHVVTSKDLIADDGKQMDGGVIDKVSGIPVLPMMKLGLYVRLF